MHLNRRHRLLVRGTILVTACLVLGASASLAGALEMQLTHNGETPEDPQRIRFYVFDPEGPEHYIAWGNAERSTVTLADGTYDVEVRFEEGFIVRTRKLEELEIAGTVTRTIDFEVPTARLIVDLTAGGMAYSPIRYGTARLLIIMPCLQMSYFYVPSRIRRRAQ